MHDKSKIWKLEYNPEELPRLCEIYVQAILSTRNVPEALEEMFKAMRGDLPEPVEKAKGIFYELDQGPPLEDEAGDGYEK